MIINEKRVAQYYRNFEKAFNSYKYNEPLSRYLTRFYKENRQMGSSDRKMTSRFLYNLFRIGNAFKSHNLIERLCFAEFLCENESSFLALHDSNLHALINNSIEDKISILEKDYGFILENIFPLINSLSSQLNIDEFLKSQFIQPDLFVRVKTGAEKLFNNLLTDNDIKYKMIREKTYSFNNGFRFQDYPKLKGKYEIQDLSSQKTIEFMDAQQGESWWDACAASGGKSLMFLDKYPSIILLVSDIRLSILKNLSERFLNANSPMPKRQKVIDLTGDIKNIIGNEKFDGILLDVPCSGSGTWGRTPEMIQQFSKDKLNEFTNLQKSIVSNIVPHIKVGKPIVYMTCSVYADENENIVQYLVDNYNFQIEKMELIKGYNHKADSMFAARLIKL